MTLAEAIEVSVDDTAQLFDPLDTSPLVGRHLDERIEQFIVHCAQEGRSTRYSLVIRTRAALSAVEDSLLLSEAIREHFSHRAQEETSKLRILVSNGKRDLLIGLIFLFICGALGLLAMKMLPISLGRLVEEGFVIIGWVALWRPVDLFLYELRPMRQQRCLFRALSQMEIRLERF